MALVLRYGWFGVGLIASLLLLGACAPKTPVKVGFIGGTSGRVADLGVSGYNGMKLAVDLANKKGGINGREIQIVMRDDEQNADVARQRYKELFDAQVAAVIGPMTSSMGVALLPQINESKLLTLAPTCTANEFAGKDDYFFRVVTSTKYYASVAAQYQYQVQGARSAAIIMDRRNKSYSESWAGDFRASFEQLGGKVLMASGFDSGDEGGLGGLADTVLRSKPDTVVLIANSVDAALLTQQIRKRAPEIKLGAAEWSATERFIELAGKSAEGTVLAQFFDRGSTAPAYLEFRTKYLERFGEEPGFAGVTAYDATNVLIEAMTRHPGLTPKEAILAIRKFAGVQNSIEFDSNGDVMRDTFVTVVRAGKFVVVPRGQ